MVLFVNPLSPRIGVPCRVRLSVTMTTMITMPFHQVRWTRTSSSRISTRRFVALSIDSSSYMKAVLFGRAVRWTLTPRARRLCTNSRLVRSMDQSRTCKESPCVGDVQTVTRTQCNDDLHSVAAAGVTTTSIIDALAAATSAALYIHWLAVHALATPLECTNYPHHHLTHIHTYTHARTHCPSFSSRPQLAIGTHT